MGAAHWIYRGLPPVALWCVAAMLIGMRPAASASDPCDSSKVQGLKGRPYSEELAQEARRLSGARLVRPIGPGIISSADRIPNRLNIELDLTRIVREFWCE